MAAAGEAWRDDVLIGLQAQQLVQEAFLDFQAGEYTLDQLKHECSNVLAAITPLVKALPAQQVLHIFGGDSVMLVQLPKKTVSVVKRADLLNQQTAAGVEQYIMDVLEVPSDANTTVWWCLDPLPTADSFRGEWNKASRLDICRTVDVAMSWVVDVKEAVAEP